MLPVVVPRGGWRSLSTGSNLQILRVLPFETGQSSLTPALPCLCYFVLSTLKFESDFTHFIVRAVLTLCLNIKY